MSLFDRILVKIPTTPKTPDEWIKKENRTGPVKQYKDGTCGACKFFAENVSDLDARGRPIISPRTKLCMYKNKPADDSKEACNLYIPKSMAEPKKPPEQS